MNRILVVAAHPDDEILGCGATMSKLSEQKNEIHILILGEGITSRHNLCNSNEMKAELENLQLEAKNAAKIIGANSIEFVNFPDNRFDSVSLLDIIKAVEKKKNELKPQIVFTHHAHDLNIDHQRTFQAVLTSCRPMKNETVREIYSFEIPSSTEWQFQSAMNVFLPTQYFTISEKHLIAKISAMNVYSSEIRDYPHPRSLKALRLLAEYRGVTVGEKYAEGFVVVRKII